MTGKKDCFLKIITCKGWTVLSDLTKQEGNPECPENLQNSSKDIMQIFFTSGTTGAPKMCSHTHGSYGYCHRQEKLLVQNFPTRWHSPEQKIILSSLA